MGSSHYQTWTGDISAYYKGKFLSTSQNAIINGSQTKAIKDTVIDNVNTIHLIHESQGGIFYTKSTDNGNTFINEEVVNFSPEYYDADGNRNSSLSLIRDMNNHPISELNTNDNVAATWERYNNATGQTEIQVATRYTTSLSGTYWQILFRLTLHQIFNQNQKSFQLMRGRNQRMNIHIILMLLI